MAARRKSNILDIVSTNDGTHGDTATQTVQPGRRGRTRSARVRVAVVRAAAHLTRAGGPAAATVDAIAKRAAVSRTTIYKMVALGGGNRARRTARLGTRP
jgi:hypothetical protein